MSKDKISTEVALSTPTINNQINMNLNQNDMIDVVIEHQLEILTNQLESNKALVEANILQIKEVNNSYKEIIFKRVSTDNEQLTQFNKIVKQYKFEVKNESTLALHTYGDECKFLETIKIIDIDQVEQYKSPYDYAKRHFNESSINLNPISYFTIDLRCTLNGLSVYYKESTINPTIDECREYNKKMNALLKIKIGLLKVKYDLSMSYLEYKYGEKRIKAKIVKASLSKSAEGRGILAMLEGATNIKLLG